MIVTQYGRPVPLPVPSGELDDRGSHVSSALDQLRGYYGLGAASPSGPGPDYFRGASLTAAAYSQHHLDSQRVNLTSNLVLIQSRRAASFCLCRVVRWACSCCCCGPARPCVQHRKLALTMPHLSVIAVIHSYCQLLCGDFASLQCLSAISKTQCIHSLLSKTLAPPECLCDP